MVGYIGRQAVNGNFIKLDSITTSATTTFNLLNGGVAYSPESARNCIVSLNGVIQSPETAYNIVGSTIVFSETLASQDVIDHIIVLGDVNTLASVSDGTITTAKVVNDAITTDKINLVSTSSTPSLEAKGDGSSDGYIQLNCSQNSHGIKLKSPPHSANASYVLTFPNNDGNADQFLKTDGSGVLSFADAGGGGKILQVVSASDSANYSVTSTSFVNSSNGLTLNITPSATTSKIFVQVSVSNLFGASGNNVFLTIYRGSTNLGGSNGMATHGGFNENVPASMTILDSPSSTSQLTYQVYAKVTGGTHDYGSTNSVSTITAFEVGA